MPSTITKSLSKLSREKLINLCVSWTKSSKCSPYLSSNRNLVETVDEDYLHEPAESRHELNQIYTRLGGKDGGLSTLSKKDIVDRIVNGDWRRGLTHHQLASIDFANLEENDASLRWTALKLVPLQSKVQDVTEHRPNKRRKIYHSQNTSHIPCYPDTTAPLFIEALKVHIGSLVKAHYHVHRIPSLKLSVIRLHILPNAPFTPLGANIPRQGRGINDAARTMFIALPDSCPYLYIAVSGNTKPETRNSMHAQVDIAGAKRIVLEAIPKALSRPQQRWSLENTRLIAKSLAAMTLLRGSGNVGIAGGQLSRLIQLPKTAPLEAIYSSEFTTTGAANDQTHVRHEERVEESFGSMRGPGHARLDCVKVKVRNLIATKPHAQKRKLFHNDSADEPAPITITFSGKDVFAGLKEFAIRYPEYLDLERFPAALTGEGGCTAITL